MTDLIAHLPDAVSRALAAFHAADVAAKDAADARAAAQTQLVSLLADLPADERQAVIADGDDVVLGTLVEPVEPVYDDAVIKAGVSRQMFVALSDRRLNRKRYEQAVTRGKIPAGVVKAARTEKAKAPYVKLTRNPKGYVVVGKAVTAA